MNTIRSTPENELSQLNLNFDDDRLTEMLFRFRARNYPDTLTDAEQKAWNKYRKNKLTKKECGSSITIDVYSNKIDALLNDNELSNQHDLLNELKTYGEHIKNSL